eukprot:SM000304S11840  [mRNA]  locus=s304:112456:113481:+ [translate_table: standard]
MTPRREAEEREAACTGRPLHGHCRPPAAPLSAVEDGSKALRVCAHCGTTKTPLWRNGPPGPKSLCNACGIRHKKLGKKAAATGLPIELFSPAKQLVVPATPFRGGGGGAGGGAGDVSAQARAAARKAQRQEEIAAALADQYAPHHLQGVKAAGYDPSAHPRKRSRLSFPAVAGSRTCCESGSDDDGCGREGGGSSGGSCVTVQAVHKGLLLPSLPSSLGAAASGAKRKAVPSKAPQRALSPLLLLPPTPVLPPKQKQLLAQALGTGGSGGSRGLDEVEGARLLMSLFYGGVRA